MSKLRVALSLVGTIRITFNYVYGSRLSEPVWKHVVGNPFKLVCVVTKLVITYYAVSLNLVIALLIAAPSCVAHLCDTKATK